VNKSRVSWNPMHWDPWERATGAIIVTFVFLGAVVVLHSTGRLAALDAWLGTLEGQTVARAFAVVAAVLGIVTALIGMFLIWVEPFLRMRAERREYATREEVRRALEDR